MILAAALAVLTAFAGGVVVGAQYERTRALRDLGLTRRTVRLYHEAAGILANLVVIDDLDAVNVLAPKARERVNRWLADHRKETTP